MGRYVGKIKHTFSTDPDRTTFSETITQGRIIYTNILLEKMTPQEQQEFVRLAKKEGLLV